MNKLPVFSTVSRTFGFILGDVATIVRIAWLPLLIAGALNFYIGGQAMDEIIAAKGNPSLGSPIMQANFLVGLAAFLANVIVVVALLRVVIFGERRSMAPFYLWFGRTEARLVLTYLLLTIAAVAAVVAGGIVLGFLAAIFSKFQGGAAITAVLLIGSMGVAIMAILKLSIVPAVVVAENSLGVERAWALMRGNALRMFFVVIMTYLPIGVAITLATFAVLGSDFPALPDFKTLLAAPQNQEAVRSAIEAWQLNLLAAMRLHWLEFAVLNFITAILTVSLLAGVTGNAYVALVPPPEAQR